MRTDKDLFAEESQMVSMSFGDHIEDLRYRLILALIALFGGMVITFIPLPVLGQSIGMYVFHTMERPAKLTLDQFYKDQAIRMAGEAKDQKKLSPTVMNHVPAKDLVEQLGKIAPRLASLLPIRAGERPTHTTEPPAELSSKPGASLVKIGLARSRAPAARAEKRQ